MRLSVSPDGRHRAELVREGEVPWGPEYYRLRLDGVELPKRLFGDCLTWHEGSRYLAAQEWLTSDPAAGPRTRVALFALQGTLCAALKTVEKGFAERFRFVPSGFVYTRQFHAPERAEEVEVEWSSIQGWRPY